MWGVPGGAQSKDLSLFLRQASQQRKLEVLRLRAFRCAKRRSAQDDSAFVFDAALRAIFLPILPKMHRISRRPSANALTSPRSEVRLRRSCGSAARHDLSSALVCVSSCLDEGGSRELGVNPDRDEADS